MKHQQEPYADSVVQAYGSFLQENPSLNLNPSLKCCSGRGSDLQDLLDVTGAVIMFLANDTGVQHSRGGIQRVHSRVDTQLCNGSGQHSGGIQVSECGGWRRICQIICWHVDSLQSIICVIIANLRPPGKAEQGLMRCLRQE